jgi:hypothetical protein
MRRLMLFDLHSRAGCNSTADIGKTVFVPYEADYVFYTNPTAATAASERN